MPTLAGVQATKSWRGILRSCLPILKLLAAVLFIIALARPQDVLKEENINSEGIDIYLALDLSSSMLAQDFKPNRLEASKAVAQEFVEKRPHDRIGLTIFAADAFTQSPLTTDHNIIKQNLAMLDFGILDDGTAIGMGLANAVNRLKESEAESKVIILLTDGENTTGYIQPDVAAELAKEFDVRVYTIGVGTYGYADREVTDFFGNKRIKKVPVVIDEELLTAIAKLTGGKYYRADTRQKLEQIYEEIDRLEKTEIEVTTVKRYSEDFHKYAFWGLILILLEVILRYTILRTIP